MPSSPKTMKKSMQGKKKKKKTKDYTEYKLACSNKACANHNLFCALNYWLLSMEACFCLSKKKKRKKFAISLIVRYKFAIFYMIKKMFCLMLILVNIVVPVQFTQ